MAEDTIHTFYLYFFWKLMCKLAIQSMGPIKNNLSSWIVSLPASINLIGWLDLNIYMAVHKETKKL